MTATSFQTRFYAYCHGSQPRGRGSWCFSAGSEALVNSEETLTEVDGFRCSVGASYVWVHQATFGQAKKVARQVAKERGWQHLFVQP